MATMMEPTTTMEPTTADTLKVDIGLTDDARVGVINILQMALADEMLLYTRLRNYHWNVTGPQFHSLHEMFEEQYTQLAETIDEIAERIRTYGVPAIGTMDEFQTHTRLHEFPGSYPDARQMVMNLVSDHEALIRYLREDVETIGSSFHDVAAEDFLTGLLQVHQDMAWMLRTFVEGRAVHE